MIALAASLLLTLYVIIPDLIFRVSLGQFIPLKSIIRSRTEEIIRAVAAVILPAAVALIFLRYVHVLDLAERFFPGLTPLRMHGGDLHTLGVSIVSDHQFDEHQVEFFSTLKRILFAQVPFLSVLYVLMWGEGSLAGWLATHVGPQETEATPGRARNAVSRLVRKFIVPKIVEWHVLFTDYLTPGRGTVIVADVLMTNEIIYKGIVIDHFLATDGKLAGIVLSEPRRFDRPRYLREKEQNPSVSPNDFWTKIPSKKFHLMADKIVNVNVNHITPAPVGGAVSDLLFENAERRKPKVRVTGVTYQPNPKTPDQPQEQERSGGPPSSSMG